MRKMCTIMVAGLALVAFVVAPTASFAGEGCSYAKKTGDKLISATSRCSKGDKAACAAKMGMSFEECQKLCASGDYTLVNMSVKGMTCGGCEGQVTASLEKIPGVIKVGAVSYKDGTAFVMINPKKVKNEALVTAVSGQGYQVEVIPAVARTILAGDTKTAGAKKGCGMSAQKASSAACAAHALKDEAKEEVKEAAEGTK
jgi:copper chaperone CopZ